MFKEFPILDKDYTQFSQHLNTNRYKKDSDVANYVITQLCAQYDYTKQQQKNVNNYTVVLPTSRVRISKRTMCIIVLLRIV